MGKSTEWRKGYQAGGLTILSILAAVTGIGLIGIWLGWW